MPPQRGLADLCLTQHGGWRMLFGEGEGQIENSGSIEGETSMPGQWPGKRALVRFTLAYGAIILAAVLADRILRLATAWNRARIALSRGARLVHCYVFAARHNCRVDAR